MRLSNAAPCMACVSLGTMENTVLHSMNLAGRLPKPLHIILTISRMLCLLLAVCAVVLDPAQGAGGVQERDQSGPDNPKCSWGYSDPQGYIEIELVEDAHVAAKVTVYNAMNASPVSTSCVVNLGDVELAVLIENTPGGMNDPDFYDVVSISAGYYIMYGYFKVQEEETYTILVYRQLVG